MSELEYELFHSPQALILGKIYDLLYWELEY